MASCVAHSSAAAGPPGLAISRRIEDQTGWSIRKIRPHGRRHRTIQIQAGPHTITAADPLPDDLRQALERSPGPVGLRANVPNSVRGRIETNLQARGHWFEPLSSTSFSNK